MSNKTLEERKVDALKDIAFQLKRIANRLDENTGNAGGNRYGISYDLPAFRVKSYER